MPRRSLIAGAIVAPLLAVAMIGSAAAQPGFVGCRRPSISTTTTTRAFGPPIAAYPGLFTTGILANGVTAFFPELVEVTTVTNFRGVEGLTRTTVHSTIAGDRTTYFIPDWLVRAYGGDTARIVADAEGGRLSDVGPCP